MPCTTILVGKKASYDGSTMIARNDDAGGNHFTAKKYVIVHPEEQPKVYKSVISHVEIPLSEHPMRYSAAPNAIPGQGIWAACGVNEKNVAMTATETITSNPRVLGADPMVVYQLAEDGKAEVPGGIGEEDIVVLVLPYINSAREGVKRLGSLLEQYGTYEKNGIAFQDVSFSYEADSQVKALSHVSFLAEQGKVTAIVGPSGGGKSTIASLISRFYDVTDGSIQIGGVDIRDIPLDALMDKVSFVFQDTFLFKQSILDNIRMGNPDATEEQVIAAAKAARCHEFIEQLPNGYQTVIGSTGVHLSGGERQRIAIARAIVKDAPIIVLDEATAFSDPENEYLIQKAFEKLIQNKTVVMIAHRLSTIRNADQILVMEKGCLIESGTHDELLKKNGKYAQMWSSYTESINWKIGTGKAV